MTDLAHGDFILCSAAVALHVDSGFNLLDTLTMPPVIPAGAAVLCSFPPEFDVAGNIYICDLDSSAAGRIMRWDRHVQLDNGWLLTEIGDGDSGYFRSTQTDSPLPHRANVIPSGFFTPAASGSLNVSTLGPYIVQANTGGTVLGTQYVAMGGSAGSWNDIEGRADRLGSVFYYRSGGGSTQPMRRWDIPGASQLADWADGNGTYTFTQIFELKDGNITGPFLYTVASGHTRPKFGYQRILDVATGSVLDEIDLISLLPSGTSANWDAFVMLSPDIVDADHFWFGAEKNTDSTSHIVKAVLSTRTVLDDIDITALGLGIPFVSQQYGLKIVHPAVMRLAPDGSTVWDVGT